MQGPRQLPRAFALARDYSSVMPSFWEVRSKLGEKAADGDEATPWSVSDLAQRVQTALRSGLPSTILVRGEISQWSRATSGHRYFTLKDANSSVEAKMWRAAAASLSFEPKVGQDVVVTGNVDFWSVRGQLSLVCDRIEPVGAGALEAAFRKLVEQLRGERLFDAERKQTIPVYPRTLAIVTSLQAAGFQDVLKVLAPFGQLRKLIYPVPVQGDRAAASIVAALTHLGQHHRDVGGVDLILLVRGGGSLQDLWCFNEESVARAIVACPIPIVTGVGHETDTTIADLVADLRCHTPTEAAQTVVRQWRIAPDRIVQLGIVLRRSVRQGFTERADALRHNRRHETFRRPTEPIERRRQRVDEGQARLAAALRGLARDIARRLQRCQGTLGARHPASHVRLLIDRLGQTRLRLSAQSPSRQLRRQREAIVTLAGRLEAATRRMVQGHALRVRQVDARFVQRRPDHRVQELAARITSLVERMTTAVAMTRRRQREQVSALERQLSALGPTRVLERGYTLTFRRRGNEIVRSPADVRPGDVLVTRTADGDITSTVGEMTQPSLFES